MYLLILLNNNFYNNNNHITNNNYINANQEELNNNVQPPQMSRQDIISEYSNKFKASMQFQFRNSFTSAGSFQPTNNLPTITYVGSKLN